jgi:hypothetical protein
MNTYNALPHRFVLEDRSLNLSQFYADAMNLNLMIHAASVLYITIGKAYREIAGSIQSASRFRREAVRYEFLRSEIWPS